MARSSPNHRNAALGNPGAIIVVFATSAAVLVLEILAGRLLAPYVGVSLETYTGIIGTILAAIAAGTAVGGRLADRFDPRRLLGPTLIAGGILACLSLPLLSVIGPSAGDGPVAIVVITTWAFFAPAAVLSAASPMVAKLRLDSLEHTGSVVGGLSAAGTAGALFGTFITGFVLVAALPTRPIVIGVGAALILGGLALWWRFSVTMPSRSTAMLVLVAMATSLGLAAANPTSCQWETAYFCVSVEHDPTNPSGRILRLDTLRHSYVDLDDPTHLEFRYIQLFADIADATTEGPIDTLHIGGGGFTFPRYLAATRPQGTDLVIEIDDELVDIAREHLGLPIDGAIDVRTDDARRVVEDLDDNSYDLVISDAFGGLSPPWHLTTREFVEEVHRVMRPHASYALNIIDGGPLDFLRAEAATLAEVFDHVAVIMPPTPSSAPQNHVLVASDLPLDPLAVDIVGVPADRGTVLVGDEVEGLIHRVRPLVDDFAPVEQLITRR